MYPTSLSRTCFIISVLFINQILCQFLQLAFGFMPTRPVISPRQCFRVNPKHGRVIRFISDQQTKCMYWECTSSRPVPRQCGLQTYISEFFEGDEYNPCTETYTDTTKQFDCTRKGFDADGTPSCKSLYEENGTCRNGGNVSFEGNLCWCTCAPGFTGYECTRRVTETNLPTVRVVGGGDPPAVPPPSTGARTNTRDRLRNEKERRDRQRTDRRQRVLLRNLDRQMIDDIDETGPILPDPPRRRNVPFSKNIQLDDGSKNEFGAPPGVEFAEQSSPPLNPIGIELADDPPKPRLVINPVIARPSGSGSGSNSRDSAPEASGLQRAPAVPPGSSSVTPRAATVDENGKFILGDPCPNGFQKDFCAEQNGCLNGGTCTNQCLGAVCQCRPPYTAGRRCEQYRCTANVECMNGGTCSRGTSGIHPVATCECLAGFAGPMCEINLADRL